jgi:hypothetical protein
LFSFPSSSSSSSFRILDAGLHFGLQGRVDDTKETLVKRFRTFKEETQRKDDIATLQHAI